MRLRRYYLALAAVLVAFAGCAGGPKLAGSRALAVPGSLAPAPDDSQPDRAPPTRSTTNRRPTDSAPDAPDQFDAQARARPPAALASGTDRGAPNAPEMTQIMTELASLGSLDPGAQQRLLADLQASDPAVWPLLMQSFRASLAYRERQAQSGSPNELAASTESIPNHPADEARDAARPSPPQSAAISAAPRRLPESAAGAAAAPVPESAPHEVATRNEAATPREREAQTVAYHADLPPAAAVSHDSLAGDIAELERRSGQAPAESAALAEQLRMRLACLAAGRRDDALRPIPGLSAGEQEYWSQQLYALAGLLDVERSPDAARRVAEASAHQSAATMALADIAPLRVTNLAFCTEVASFGVCKRVEPAEFKAAQEVLLYAEIENLKSESTPQGSHTSLESSYQILDAQGRRVAHEKLPLTEEHCQNRRRDYFVRYFVTLPERIYPGVYHLDLTVEDTIGRKVGQSQIDFTVKK